MIRIKVTITWDNLNYETIRTTKSCLSEDKDVIIVRDGGLCRSFNKSYIRKIEVLDEDFI